MKFLVASGVGRGAVVAYSLALKRNGSEKFSKRIMDVVFHPFRTSAPLREVACTLNDVTKLALYMSTRLEKLARC